MSLVLYAANKKLSDMTAELSKAQEHARRFQELLMTERRKQKSLKVYIHVHVHVHTYMSVYITQTTLESSNGS